MKKVVMITLSILAMGILIFYFGIKTINKRFLEKHLKDMRVFHRMNTVEEPLNRYKPTYGWLYINLKKEGIKK